MSDAPSQDPANAVDAANDGGRSRSSVPPDEGDMGEDSRERREDWGEVVNGMGEGLLLSFAGAALRPCPPRNEHTSTPPIFHTILRTVPYPSQCGFVSSRLTIILAHRTVYAPS